jgi:hypothetical protein
MSRRGLLVALLCGLLGVGLGVIVAYASEPRTSYSHDSHPMSAVSPSVPIDVKHHKPYATDIAYPTLEPGLALPTVHTIGNELAHWTYHVPQDWQAYAVCGPGDNCRPPIAADTRLNPQQVDHQLEVRFRPGGEPSVGGYSLRVKVLDNTLNNLEQMVATKLVGFRQGVKDFKTIEKGPSSVYFAYRDPGTNYHRFNFFQWFAVPGQPNATLEMSVSGRQQDVPGLKALFDRFADNVTGELPPESGPGKSQNQKQNQKQDQ